ncbi:hypothetical protein Tco_1225017 [Tanacetum coccineum]
MLHQQANVPAQFMASLSNRSGGGANDASLLEDEDYDIYDGLENDDYDISEEQLTFCDAFDITLRGRVRKYDYLTNAYCQ